MRQDDFKNRYIIKVLSSVLIAIVNMIIQVLLPRLFSVEDYGYYTYNLNVFTSVVVIANLSSSNALISKYSKRNDEIGLVYFYLKFFAAMSILLTIGTVILYQFDFIRSVFAGQTLIVVLLGIETAIVTKLLTDCISMYDASAISRFPALIQVLMKGLISATVILGFFYGSYNLVTFYIVQFVVTALAISILLIAIIKDQQRRYPQIKSCMSRQYIGEFVEFCKPLVVANIVAQVVVIIMNWALMKWSGVAEQAIFGVAWQLNSLISYVFSPYAELSKREFAVLNDNVEQLKNRFVQSLKLMFWLTSYFAIFTAFMSGHILPIIYGDKYSNATLVTAIIMFYTVYQSWGQITGSYMISREKTKANAIISIIGQLLTVAGVFLFQMPNVIWDESLGAIGIAVNYLVANIITSIISVCYISTDLGISKLRNCSIQIMPISSFSVVAFALKFMCDRIILCSGIWDNILKVLISGLLYTAITLGIIFAKPSLVGLSSESLKRIIRRKTKL